MIRTHIYLTEEQAHAVKIKSLREQKPKAQILREVINKGLALSDKKPKKTTGQALLELAELGKKLGMTGPTDLSTNHDDYLYGDKK